MVDTDQYFLYSGGSADITPAKRVQLAGFAPRTQPFLGIGDPLETNAVVLGSGDSKVVFVSADLLYIGKELRAGVLERNRGVLKDEELFISSTHNHYAPGTDPAKSPLGKTDGEYLEFVIDKMASLVQTVLSREARPVTVSFSKGANSACSINRRRFGRVRSKVPRKEMLILPNPDGCKDPAVRILRFCDGAGNTVAVAWNYCCHPVGYHDSSRVSSDYPGAVRAMLRAKYGGTIPIIFWQGFSGDVNPPSYLRRPKVLSRSFIEYFVFRMLNGKEFGPYTSTEWKQWVDGLGESVVLASTDEGRSRVGGKLAVKRTAIPLRSMGFESEDELVLHEVMLGGLRIVGLSAEPVAAYVPILEKMFPGEPVIPVGCIDKTTLYLPTTDMLMEGGYEAEGFAKYFGIRGRFSPGFQEKVEQALRSL